MTSITIIDDTPDEKKFRKDSSSTSATAHGPILGQWYWILNCTKSGKEIPDQLGCATAIGSNFVKIEQPNGNSHRIHLENFWTDLRHEPNALTIINQNAKQHAAQSQRLMKEVQELTLRLGLKSAGAIGQGNDGNSSSTALAVLSGQSDVNAYGRELEKAKKHDLPELFLQIEKEHKKMEMWLKASSLPMTASMRTMRNSLSEIDDRIFNVSLYAGLAENCVQCGKGAPGELEDKLHVMQRMLYMDEESLLDYKHGGMDFNGIASFDEWLCKPNNRDRILPFPRTLVAMRVRRTPKNRDHGCNLAQAYINMKLEQADKTTFLYIRNGEQVWRLNCEMDFGELIFPDKSIYDPSEPKMAKMCISSVEKMISTSEYETLCAEHERKEILYDKWQKENPDKSWIHNPHRNYSFSPADWRPVDQTNVYYDECLASIDKQIKEYNRVALIIQGVFDRSMVLHPHLPVQSWTADGFERAITLVSDGTRVLHYGQAPDFEAYRRICNESLGVGSITVGQEAFWEDKEIDKEMDRRSSEGFHSSYRPQYYRPHNNPGPGETAQVVKWSAKKKEASFEWQRQGKQDRRETFTCHLTVPQENLLNINAYQLGDFKQFFADPRTREQYRKWAPLLLAAEEYKWSIQNSEKAEMQPGEQPGDR